MLLAIEGILTEAEVTAIREVAATLDFADGTSTAGGDAASVKANAQAVPSPDRDAVLEKARRAILGNDVFNAAARPRDLTPLLLSRYRPGQTYGWHVDNTLMGGLRTDLSFTLFLSDPGTYEGGALEIEDTFEDRNVRLKAGDLVLYPTTALHRVAPVTQGERLAIVGWCESWVRDGEAREILFDLDRVMAGMDRGAARDRLGRVRGNLLRRWAGR